MGFNDIYTTFKLNILKIINTKKYDNYILSEEKRDKLMHYIRDTEEAFISATNDIDNKITKLDTAIYIENSTLEEKMNIINQQIHEDLNNLELKKDEEINVILRDLNDEIRKINDDKNNYEKQINNDIENINQAISAEIAAYDSNEKYYDTLIKKAAKRYDDYNTIIFNKIINIDINQPKTPKFNAQHDKFKRVIEYLKYFKRDNVSDYDVADGDEFASVINGLSDPIDDIITSLEEHSLFQTRIDNLREYNENLNKTYLSDKNKIEKIKHEVSAEYNRHLHNKNVHYNDTLASTKGNNERKLKSIDKRIEKQKKDYSDESARISEDYVSHITNISNEINNLDKENKRLIDNYNREYYFTYYKTLFEYNELVSSIKDKTSFNSDQRNKYEQKRLDNFEIKSYQQKLKSLKLKHDKYIEQLNQNIIQQINHNNYEITESNLYKLFDLTTSKIKHESFIKKSKLLKDNIEKSASYSYKISSLNHDNKIINLRFDEYDNKRKDLDYEIEKMEIEHHARRDKIERKIEKYSNLMKEYQSFVENDNNLIKMINDSNHNTKLTVYYFEIRKNNILKEYNKEILELAKTRANEIRNYKLNVYKHMINKLKQNLLFYQEKCDYKLAYHSNKFNAKQEFINKKYEAKINHIKNEYNRKKNIKAIMFERNNFRHDNLKSSQYSDYAFSIYSYSTILHITLINILSDNVDLVNQINKVFISFYIGMVKSYYNSEKDNLETRLNNIYYYKNSVSIKKLLNQKEDIILKYDSKINNLQAITERYQNNLNIFNNNDNDMIKINHKHLNKVKKALIKDIKLYKAQIEKLADEENEKINSIENIILKNKKRSIIHYQNYHIFKKTMDKIFNQTIKNINNIEHKAKNTDLTIVLESHRTFIASLKVSINKIFKNFTMNVESEFPKENQKVNNTCNSLNNIYDSNENKAINIYNKQINKLTLELKKNLKIPNAKGIRQNRIYYVNIKLLELKHSKSLLNFKKNIKELQNNLINNEIETSDLISSVQASNKKLVKRTKEKQQEQTNKYINTISTIKYNYINEINNIDRTKKINMHALKDKYQEITEKLKHDKNIDISKCNKEVRLNDYKLKEIQRVYKKNLSNIDADLINDRVDQQILLSQKLKKLKRLFIKNKDLSSLEDADYSIVTLSNYEDVSNKIE